MDTSVTPSDKPITSEQIGKFEELFGDGLRKTELLSEPAKEVLKTSGDALVAELVAVVHKYLAAVTSAIVCWITVNRNRTPQQVLDDTGRQQYTDKAIVATMPKGEGDKVKMTFFKPGRRLSPAELAAEYKRRRLKPDPVAQAQYNADHPEFADTTPNGTNWPLPGGGYGYMAVSRDDDERYVFVGWDDDDWHDHWSFGGVPE